MYLCIQVFKHTCISKSRLINDKQEGNIPNLGISDHSQVAIQTWEDVEKYRAIYLHSGNDLPRNIFNYISSLFQRTGKARNTKLTNFNHCMMTINSRGLAGGGGGLRTAVGMNSIYCSYFFQNNFILVSMTGFLHAFTCIIMYQPTIFISNLIQNISEC